MDKVISADGTPIAYEAVGRGPTVVLVGGAFCDHHATAELAVALADDFTAVSYDRRGRGGSGDTLPYDVRREVADIEALIRHFGDRAVLHGISSGGALRLVAAASDAPVDAVSVLEPPYRVSQDAPQLPDGYTDTLVELTSAGRRGDAVAHFMTQAVGRQDRARRCARRARRPVPRGARRHARAGPQGVLPALRCGPGGGAALRVTPADPAPEHACAPRPARRGSAGSRPRRSPRGRCR